MWARIEDNQIKEIVIGNKGIDINGIQYPSSIFSLWSKEELFNIGLVPYSISKSGDNRIKTEGGVINEISADKKSVVGVTQYTDKPLDDVILYDSDGKEMLNDDGTTAVIEGLKTSYKRIVDERCYNILNQTDWYVVKHTELGSVIPETISGTLEIPWLYKIAEGTNVGRSVSSSISAESWIIIFNLNYIIFK